MGVHRQGAAKAFPSGRGQALVEFALLFPLLMLATLSVVDGARVFTAFVSVSNASREAALYAAQGTNYLKWCANPQPADSVPCPPGATSVNYSPDPDNVARRIADQGYGLDHAALAFDPPQCGDGTSFATCTVANGATATRVRVHVTYSMTLVTPLLDLLWGHPVIMGSQTEATILR